MPFCILFFYFIFLIQNWKKIRKIWKKIKIKKFVPLPLNQNKIKKTQIPNPSPIQNPTSIAATTPPHNPNPLLLASTTTTTTTSSSKILQQCDLIESLTSPDLHDTAIAVSSSSSTLKVYCGFNPTAQSLHLGLIVLSWFHRFGHQPITLIGDTTASFRDPSSKSLKRLDLNSLCYNTIGIQSTIARILFKNFVILNNYDW